MKPDPSKLWYVLLDLGIAVVAYYFVGWIGFACVTLFMVLYVLSNIHDGVKITMATLLSRLPNRCAMCHREIVDEGGILDLDLDGETRVYHGACSDKLDRLKASGIANP